MAHPSSIALLMMAVSASRVYSWRKAGDTRPNIILFHPDTIRAEALGTYGHPISKTPNFDKMAGDGVLFEDAHVQHTQCSPSRCAMVTGRYMHVLGHRTQTHLVRSYEPNFFALLKQVGYTNILLGKNDMLSPDSFNASFDYWEGAIGVAQGPQAYPTYGEAGYYSFLATAAKVNGSDPTANGDLKAVQLTLDWLHSDPPEPWMMYLPGLGGHPNYGAPADYFGMYTAEQVRQAAPLRQLSPGSQKPPHLGLGGIAGYRNLSTFDTPAEDLFYQAAAIYLGRIAYVDYLLGQLMEGLSSSPMANTTALIVHSDHGDYSGDWLAVEKWPGGLEDVLTHVPLLASIPGGARGVRVQAPVMSIDLYPTLLDLAGVKQNASSPVHFGYSLMPWLTSGTAPPASQVHDYVFSEGGYSNWNEYEPNDPEQASTYADPTNAYFPRGREELKAPLHIDRAVMIRNSTAKLVYRPRGVCELYDLTADPREEWNVYPNASYTALRTELTSQLLSWIVLTSDVTPVDDDNRNLPPVPTPPFPWPPKRVTPGAGEGSQAAALLPDAAGGLAVNGYTVREEQTHGRDEAESAATTGRPGNQGGRLRHR